MTSARPSFPTIIDASMLSAFRACPRKFAYEYLDHWRYKGRSVHLHAGAAFAAGLEAARLAYYVEGKHPDDSISAGLATLARHYGDFDCPPTSAKSCERMLGALEYYFHSYQLGSDRAIPVSLPSGQRGIEFSFCEPLPFIHPESGEPLLYSGRFDMLVDYDGMRLGEDDKTTSALGASWPQQWDLRSQFTGYAWGSARAGLPLDGFLVRGIAIRKTGYDTLQAITYRPQWQIDRWFEQVRRDIARMLDLWARGVWDYNLGDECTAFGGCMFRNVCLTVDPTAILSAQYERRRWDPAARTETLIIEEGA